jgi:two-component system alkaline phosphatase synthesis response regulator PhoP
VTIKLTTREKQILHLSSLGLPIKQIAAQLEVSQRTIEKHRANIMQKTDTNSIIEAIHVCNQNSGYKLLNAV